MNQKKDEEINKLKQDNKYLIDLINHCGEKLYNSYMGDKPDFPYEPSTYERIYCKNFENIVNLVDKTVQHIDQHYGK